ncbi:MAG: FecR domain-containing protein [Nannocystaceae bacterium]|nr:FecR domain-containing protein [Nannocystaceae bacterium]
MVALGLGCPSSTDPPEDSHDNNADVDSEPSTIRGPVATVANISGPSGLASADLPPGTFLGKGAVLSAGQTVETPRGTLAELQLADGTKVRLNEDTALKVPTTKWPRRFELTRGEIVTVTAAGGEPIEIVAGSETLSVIAGEAQARNIGDARHYAVISGHASLKTPSKTIEMGPGASLDAPLPEDTYKDGPELSLAAIDETAWTRTFASAARMTETVPRGVGSLTARRAGSRSEKQHLRLTDQKVTVNIAGRVAHTEIEQTFFNDRPVVLEGIYRFPLPSDGSISGLGLLVGNRWMKGEVLEKQRARNIFSQIVDATIPRDPALLEWEQGNMFKLRVFPIPGRGARKVRLSYTQVLPVVAGKLRYRFPMGGSGAGGTPIDNFTFTVNVDRSELDTQQLAEIDTPMLALNQRLDGDTVRLSTSVKNFIPTSDLGVDVPLAQAAHRVHAATHLDKDGQAYFMLALRPEFDSGRTEGATHVSFVVDRSHSTTPELLTMAQGIVQAMASTLSPDDRFTVLACDTACSQMPGGLSPNSAAAIADAGQFMAKQDLAGASDLGAMMRAGADALGTAPAGNRVVVYLGDGAPTSGALAPDELLANLRGPMQGARVLAIAMGARSDLTSLGAVLEAAGGEVVRADPRDDIRELVRDLSLRVRVPMVSDLQLDLPDGMLMVRKQGTSGLRKDDTLLVAGKLSHAVSGEVRLRGRSANGPVETTFAVELTAARGDRATSTVHEHLPRTWAQMQISHLTKTKGAAAKDEIIALSQDYTVLSRFTAMLVLENDAMFREFNVVRRETDKDQWDGGLPPPEPADGDVPESEPERKTLDPLGEAGLKTPTTASGSAAGGATRTDKEKRPKGQAPGLTPLAGNLSDSDDNGAASPPGAFPPLPAFGGEDDLRTANRGKPPNEPEPDVAGTEEEDADDRRFDDDEAPAAPKKTAKNKKRAAPSSKSSRGPGSGNGDGWHDEKQDRKGRRKRSTRWRPPALRVRTVSAPSSRSIARIDELARRVALDPTKRSAHGRLVRSAIRAGHPDATEFARAWAEVDPEHPAALRSLADMLAAAGDPMAARAYASAAEVRPFDAKQHRALAAGLAGKGDLTRACSHRHAIVSIDPTKIEHHAAFVRCLAKSGRPDDARRALADGRARAKGKAKALTSTLTLLEAELARLAVPPELQLHRGAQLRASLSWSGEDELDVVVVDRRGNRLSAMRPGDKLRTREGRGFEELTMRKVKRSVFIEVTRLSDTPEASLVSTAPVSGTLTIKTSGGRRKTIPFTMRGGTIRLAKVFWSR